MTNNKNEETQQPLEQYGASQTFQTQNDPTLKEINDISNAFHEVHSLTFMILGFVLFFPLLINLMYLKSPNPRARLYSLISLIYGSIFLSGALALIYMFDLAYFIDN